jgi:tetratricopeptide (TPR) repeat protein
MSGSLFDQYKAALRRGHLAAVAHDLEAALDAYAEASRLVPERALPIVSQGTVLHRLDRWEEASEAFEYALQLAPDDEATLRARAVARDERGLRPGAAADYERLAFVLDVAGRSAEAAGAARLAAELEPTGAREALADRLMTAATHVADRRSEGTTPPGEGANDEDADDAGVEAFASPFAAAPLDAVDPRLAFLEEAEAVADEPAVKEPEAKAGGQLDAASAALAARIAELGTQPNWVDMNDRAVGEVGELGPDGKPWPAIDLPSPPPPPLEGPPPDPEALLAEAAELVAAGDLGAARDRMLLAAMVHRAAGRLDAALEVCLQLLTTAPGDPQVHLAIANLQLDHGWTELATEKIELLLRLTSLTGDTQAEADVHGLASERLRDDVASAATGR